MRKLLVSAFASALAAGMCLGLAGCGGSTATESIGAKDDGNTTMTVMVYMDGADLESYGKNGTMDLKEMCKAKLGDRVNVVVETGGAKQWHTSCLKGKTLKRSVIENGKVKVLEEEDPAPMTDPSTLSSFIQWGTSTYPADRYALIMWDHGGGTQTGYGLDQNFDKEETMDLAEIQEGLEDGGAHFEFVGFDACLMGTLETAAAVSSYADYLIASEESEGANGWYYTNWLTQLGKAPNASTPEIGKVIVDQFVNGPDAEWYDESQLSVIDCSKVGAVYDQLSSYLGESKDYITSNEDGYKKLASVRAKTKSFGQDEFDQVDILTYAADAEGVTGIGYDGLKQAIEDAVVYSDTNIDEATGLAMLYPYEWPDYYEPALEAEEEAGIGTSECTSFFNGFLTLTVMAQEDNGGSGGSFLDFVGGLLGSDSSEGDYTTASWYDKSLAGDSTNRSFNTLNDSSLELQEDEEGFYIALTDEEWSNVRNVATGVYLADDEYGGWWDLGVNDVYEYDESTGTLAVDFDYEWVTVNDEFIAYYNVDYESSDDGSTWRSYGYSPAILNDDTNIEVLICYDQDNPDGQVVGYRMASTTDEEAESHSGYDRSCLQLEDGDVITFTFDYYNGKGVYKSSEPLDDDIVYDSSQGLTVGTAELDDSYEASVAVRVTDIYNNSFWTDEVLINS